MTKLKTAIAIATLCALMPLTAAVAAEDLTPKHVADIVNEVIRAHRTTYAKLIVQRLANEEEVIEVSGHWKDDAALLLPAQMFRETAELVNADNDLGLSYSLLSLWPISAQNNAKTETEKQGMQLVVDHPEQAFYGEETLGGSKYFTAIYPDLAVSEACVSCHNDSKDSPRDDFKLGDVMGAVVIRIKE